MADLITEIVDELNFSQGLLVDIEIGHDQHSGKS